MLKAKTIESKQVGMLYHYCNSVNMVRNIKNNKLTSSPLFGMWNCLSSSKSTVSLTRDGSKAMLLQLKTQIGTMRESPVVWKITIDGDKLSNNKKLTPYNYKGRTNSRRGKPREQDLGSVKSRQNEEFLDSDLDNLSSFVLNVKCCSFIELKGGMLVKETNNGLVKLTKEEAKDTLNTISIVKKAYGTVYYFSNYKTFPTLDSLVIALNEYIDAQ